jgi:hypothetical protein
MGARRGRNKHSVLVCDAANLGDDRVFAVLEQRRYEECEAVPSPENDAVVGSAFFVWSDHYIWVQKSFWKQNYPIAVSGTAVESVVRNLPKGSKIFLMLETLEVYESLKATNDIIQHYWERHVYGLVPGWIRLIQTM